MIAVANSTIFVINSTFSHPLSMLILYRMLYNLSTILFDFVWIFPTKKAAHKERLILCVVFIPACFAYGNIFTSL